MIFSPEQIQQLFNIIDYRMARVVADVLGKEFLTPDDKALLLRNGFDIEKELKKIPPYWQAFLFGRLASLLTDNQLKTLDYTDIQQYVERKQYKEPSHREMAEYRAAATRTYSYIKGMGNRVRETLTSSLSEQEIKNAVEERRIEDLSVLKREIELGVIEKRSIQGIVSNLGHQLQDWNRDWGRIVETEMQDIFQIGKAQTIMEEHGIDARVYKDVFSGACFPTEDTEFLTNEGFKYLKDIKGNELAATYNLQTNSLEYSPILSKIQYFYEGTMHSYSHRTLDLINTPNHKMLVSLDHRKNNQIITSNYLVDSTETLKKKLYYMRYAVENWNGVDEEYITIAGFNFKTDTFVKFLGWYLSEGFCTKRGSDSKGRFHAHSICIGQLKQQNFEEIINCLKDVFNKNVNKNPNGFVISLDKSYDNFIDWLKNLGDKAWKKTIPQEIKCLSKKYLLIFLDAYIKGDGYYSYGGIDTLGKKHTAIITSSSRMRDDLYEIIIKCGFRVSGQILNNIGKVSYDKRGVRFETKRLTYVIRILVYRKFTSIYKTFKEIENWKGFVGCIEVEKNNTILIRRSGTCIWVGNCKHCIQLYTTEGIGSKPREFKLSSLIANGNNIGVKVKDWKATLGPVHPFCFSSPFIEITTLDGPKWIKDIKVGDTVLTHLNRYRRVARVFKRKTPKDFQEGIFDIYYVVEDNSQPNGYREEGLHRVTGNHSIFVNNKKKMVKNLRIGEVLQIRKQLKGRIVRIMEIPRKNYGDYLYNFEVEQDHSYFAEGVAVSNCRCELHYIPDGYVWDEESQSFTPPKNYQRKVERKSKVKIYVGDKVFES